MVFILDPSIIKKKKKKRKKLNVWYICELGLYQKTHLNDSRIEIFQPMLAKHLIKVIFQFIKPLPGQNLFCLIHCSFSVLWCRPPVCWRYLHNVNLANCTIEHSMDTFLAQVNTMFFHMFIRQNSLFYYIQLALWSYLLFLCLVQKFV